MKNNGKTLISKAIKSGLTLLVFYGDSTSRDDLGYAGTDPKKAWDAATACDDATVKFVTATKPDNNGKRKLIKKSTEPGHGWVYLVHINDPDETVANYNLGGFAASILD